MEIIIHGKPLDASERYTSGIDQTLARKIIDEFFALGTLKEPEALVVEARYWQRTWTSVYTLLLSKSVQDRAGRNSYFAISLVLPQKYCGIVSSVYKLLEKVIKEDVLGVYLNSNLQYIVPNFENAAAFEKLCAKLKSAYANFEKAYDNLFQPQATFTNDAYCSIYDCDSLAFVQLLRKKGRVIVTEKEDTKDDLAALSTKYRQEAQNAKNDAETKSLKITKLESYVKQLEDAAKKANSTESRKLNELRQQITSLTSQNEQVSQKCQTAQKQYEELREKVAQAVASLGVPKSPPRSPKKKKTNFSAYLPLVNTLLLLLMAMGLLLNLKGCSKSNHSTQDVDAQVGLLNVPQNEELSEKDGEIRDLRANYDLLKQELESYKTEISNKDNSIKQKEDLIASLKKEIDRLKPKKKKEDSQKNESGTQKGISDSPKGASEGG